MLVVAVKGDMQFYVQEDEIEGFKAAGYELYKQELVPLEEVDVKKMKMMRAQNTPSGDAPTTVTASSELIEPVVHELEEA